MSKELTIIDKDYIRWVEDLSVRYRQSQIRAAVRVNRELLKYYWELGRDIEEMRVEERWGEKVIKNLSVDYSAEIPTPQAFLEPIYITQKKFYLLYSQYPKVVPQAVEQLQDGKVPQPVAEFEVCPTNCGTIGRDAFLHTLGASPLLDGQVQ